MDSPYSGVASLRSVRMAILAGQLNNLKITAFDVVSAYLEAKTREKLYIIAGPEFGELQGHILIVEKALYGLRTSGARWAESLADELRNDHWTQSIADPAVWMKDKGTHYDYIVCWVDDAIIISDTPDHILTKLKKVFSLQNIGEPKYYLGADMGFQDSPEKVFVMGSSTYLKCILEQFERLMGYVPPKNVTSPLDPLDHPELYESPIVLIEKRRIYWSLIGMLQWSVTLGRMDIGFSVSTMSQFRAEPREGHFDRVARIFGFIKNYRDFSIKFRTDKPDYSGYEVKHFDWEYLYEDAGEENPKHMPEP